MSAMSTSILNICTQLSVVLDAVVSGVVSAVV